jgi:hypothetical protein
MFGCCEGGGSLEDESIQLSKKKFSAEEFYQITVRFPNQQGYDL